MSASWICCLCLRFVFNVKWVTRNKHHDVAGYVHSTQCADPMCSCSFEFLTTSVLTFLCVLMWLHESLNVWYNFKFTPKLYPSIQAFCFDYVLSGFVLRQPTHKAENEANEAQLRHTIKFMIFYLICLACSNDLSIAPFCFLSFSTGRAPLDALGRWLFPSSAPHG